MPLSQQEYDAIIADETKIIAENIVWESSPNSPTRRFRAEVDSDEGYPIFVDGWYNPSSTGASAEYMASIWGPTTKTQTAGLWERSTRITGCRGVGRTGPICLRTLLKHGTGLWKCGVSSVLKRN